MSDTAPLPQLVQAHQYIGWNLLQSVPADQRGDLLYQEAARLADSVQHEIARLQPDQEVDKYAMILELRASYLLRDVD